MRNFMALTRLVRRVVPFYNPMTDEPWAWLPKAFFDQATDSLFVAFLSSEICCEKRALEELTLGN